MSYVGILYSKPTPLDLNLLKKELGGRITKNTLVLDDFEISRNGSFKVHAPDEKIASTKLQRLVEKIKGLTNMSIVGIGTYNSKGKLQVFFPLLSDAMDLLETKAQEILLELGLSEDSVEPQARIIANEILCGIIREGEIVNEKMVPLGLDDYAINSGFIVIDENLQNLMLDSYAKLIRGKKIDADERFPLIRRLIKRIKLEKDELIYGITAALILETVVRLIVLLMESRHSEKGETEIPSSLASHIEKEIITASELGNALKTDELHALLILNALESLGILCIVDEFSRVFKKTGKTSIPNVVGEFRKFRGEEAVASSVFHQALHKDFERVVEGEWLPDREIMNKLNKAFLQTKG